MQFSSVVLLQSDTRIAQSLITSLSRAFVSVHAVHSLDDLRASMVKHRTTVAILDLEVASLKALQRLCREFPQTSVVGTHRLADEELWASALRAGAVDVCSADDPQSVLAAAVRNIVPLHKAAA